MKRAGAPHAPTETIEEMSMERFGQPELDYLKQVIASGKLGSKSGEFTTKLEERFAEWLGAEHGVAMNSAMSVLHAAVAAVGVGPGDEVVCDPIVHFGGAAVMYHNGVPIFCDIDADSYNMDPECLETCITERTRAIICTPFWGNPCDYEGILRVADKHGIPVIEDAAHAVGARYRDRAIGTLGAIGSFSFQEAKHLTSGDGGMAVTDRQDLADSMRQMRIIGWRPQDRDNVAERWKEGRLGWNFRMTELVAAVMHAQLDKAEDVIALHQEAARIYLDAAAESPWLVPQRVEEGAVCAYHKIVFRFEGDSVGISKERFVEALQTHGCRASVGHRRRPSTMDPIFTEIRAYGHDCPIRCPHYKGEARYGAGVTPVAERAVPRIVMMGADVWSPVTAEENAGRLHGALKEFR